MAILQSDNLTSLGVTFILLAIVPKNADCQINWITSAKKKNIEKCLLSYGIN